MNICVSIDARIVWAGQHNIVDESVGKDETFRNELGIALFRSRLELFYKAITDLGFIVDEFDITGIEIGGEI